jgi:hypothetical protein
MIIPAAITGMLIFIWMNYTVQKRREKRDSRREETKEKTNAIIAALKNKQDQNLENT